MPQAKIGVIGENRLNAYDMNWEKKNENQCTLLW